MYNQAVKALTFRQIHEKTKNTTFYAIDNADENWRKAHTGAQKDRLAYEP